MAFYFVAHTRIIDPNEYARYLERFDEIFSKFKGQYIAIDECPVIIEGNRNYNKSVLIKFHSREDFEDWFNSEDYREIMKHRLKSSESDIILVEGVD